MSPMRPIASQPGGATAGPAVCTLMALVCRRRWNAIPRSVRGVARIDTCRDPASRLSRTINPALTQRSRFSMLATRTTAAKLPYTRLETKRNSSAVPQMSAPDPSMVHVPAENAVVPAAPTAPMSLLENPPGMSGDREATGDRDPVTAAAGRDHAQPGDVAGRAGVLPDALTGLRRQVGAACHRLERPSIVHRIRQRHRRQDVRRIEDAVRHRVRHTANHRVP